jgi:hypothetical protein
VSTAGSTGGRDAPILTRRSERRRRFRLSLFFVLGLLAFLSIAAMVHLSRDDGLARLFVELHEGMTLEEVRKVFSYGNLTTLDPMPKEWSLNVDYQDSVWLPPATIQMDFVDGRLKKKHLFRPSLSYTMSFLWHRLSRL